MATYEVYKYPVSFGLALATGYTEARSVPRTASLAAVHVGQHIVGRRRALGTTQDQLAAASGIDSSNIRAYENGRNMPNLHSLMRLAGALSVEPGELLEGLTLDMFGQTLVPAKKESPPALSR